MSTPNESARGVKTLGIRLQPDIHAQLSFIAQLREGSITDEIQLALASHIQAAKDDSDLRSRADAARADVEREAAARQAAIATLFADGGDPSDGGSQGGRTTRRAPKGGDSTAAS